MPPLLECVIFCDDIREEAGNKVTLVGVYGKHLLLPSDAKFPGAMRQLCLFLRWRDIRGGERLYIDIDYEGESMLKADQPSILKAPQFQDEYAQTSAYFVPFLMKGYGKYLFKVFLESRDNALGEAYLLIEPQPRTPQISA